MASSTGAVPTGNAGDGGVEYGPATGASRARRHLAPPAQLPALTSTRFFGALMIMVFHTTADTPLLAGAPLWLRSVITSGYVWVGYFFILSGFILAYQYVERYRAGTFDARGFWHARLARIYPGHVAGFILIFLVGLAFPTLPLGPQHASTTVNAVDVGLTAALMHAWVPTFALTYNFPSWALSAEWFFYLLFPLLVVAAARWPLRRVLLLASIGLAMESAASLVYCATAAQGWAGNTTAVNTAAVAFIKFSPAVRLAEFVFGVALARIYSERERLKLDEKFGSRLIGGAMCLIAAGLLSSFAVPFALMHNVVLTIPFGAAILGLALAPRGMAARALSLRHLVALGDASYSLYILHGSFAFFIYATGWMNRAIGFEAVAGRIALVLLAIGAALLFHRHLEEPARRWIRSHGRRRVEVIALSVICITSMTSCDEDAMEGPMPVGRCGEYIRYSGTATILSVEPANESGPSTPPCYNGYEVLFNLSDDISRSCSKDLGYFNDNVWTLTLANGWAPGPAYLDKYNIEEGTIFNCVLSVQRNGPCTPCIIELEGVDIADYFECK